MLASNKQRREHTVKRVFGLFLAAAMLAGCSDAAPTPVVYVTPEPTRLAVAVTAAPTPSATSSSSPSPLPPTPSPSPAPTASAALATSPTPSPSAGPITVDAQLPVKHCATTTSGYDWERAAPPGFWTATLPIDLADSYTFYGAAEGLVMALGPTGWDCEVSIGPYGDWDMQVFDPRDPMSSVIEARGAPGRPSNDVLAFACPYFPEAAQLAKTAPVAIDCTTPRGRAPRWVSATDVELSDGAGTPIAAVHFDPSVGTSRIACTMDKAHSELCGPVVATFLAHPFGTSLRGDTLDLPGPVVSLSPTTGGVSLPVIRCPGTNGGGTPATPPSSWAATVPAGLASSVAAYGFDTLLLLAPKGWRCSDAGIAGDQGFHLLVASPTDPHALVGLDGNGGSNNDVIGGACPYWADAAKAAHERDQFPYNCTVPEGRQWRFVTPGALTYIDPVGTAANGDGRYATRGAIAYDPALGFGEVYCSLPDSQAALCDAVVADFLTHPYDLRQW